MRSSIALLVVAAVLSVSTAAPLDVRGFGAGKRALRVRDKHDGRIDFHHLTHDEEKELNSSGEYYPELYSEEAINHKGEHKHHGHDEHKHHESRGAGARGFGAGKRSLHTRDEHDGRIDFHHLTHDEEKELNSSGEYYPELYSEEAINHKGEHKHHGHDEHKHHESRGAGARGFGAGKRSLHTRDEHDGRIDFHHLTHDEEKELNSSGEYYPELYSEEAINHKGEHKHHGHDEHKHHESRGAGARGFGAGKRSLHTRDEHDGRIDFHHLTHDEEKELNSSGEYYPELYSEEAINHKGEHKHHGHDEHKHHESRGAGARGFGAGKRSLHTRDEHDGRIDFHHLTHEEEKELNSSGEYYPELYSEEAINHKGEHKGEHKHHDDKHEHDDHKENKHDEKDMHNEEH
ncbi:hypothetical protein J056_002089 [Wallemia ichthyophaga EXF-994]|uniref:Histidine-rich glycoprotein n=1 Tax=Wallemia ichthyophaga (strain EXF-994 / CBS 113033) TaxID=1299270 RepID=R9AV83_WALI9|nr:uncharacterized protein J056_002089 [Wallemia ichthyophaga EXF-994]EOR04011.1 hypothetical protein J056_002089 [Wallemia ichthyophaga EXF-994]